MWQDMKTYWAWRGKESPNCSPPSKKELKYASIVYKNNTFKLVVYVRENGKLYFVSQRELGWHSNNGAKINRDNTMNILEYLRMMYGINRAMHGRIYSAWIALFQSFN